MKTIIPLKESFIFIGDNWSMMLQKSFFWNKSLACCRKAIKYALEDVDANRVELKLLQALLKIWTEDKSCPEVTEGRYCKFLKLLEFMEGKI